MNKKQTFREYIYSWIDNGATWENELDGLDKSGVAFSVADKILAILFDNKPPVVCLCGSTRFYETWQEMNFNLTIAGEIVLSVGFWPHAVDKAHAANVGITPEQKIALDELHKRKIDLADYIYVLNVGGYIGESTRSEIDYATAHGKPVKYLEETPDLLKG